MNDPPKSEKQKMLAGQLYLASDPELAAEHQRACQLLHAYNATPETDLDKRVQILQDLFGQVGENPQITPPLYCDYGSNIYAGNGLYMNSGCTILDCNIVCLGDNVLCGPAVQIYTAYHPIDLSRNLKALRRAGFSDYSSWLNSDEIHDSIRV